MSPWNYVGDEVATLPALEAAADVVKFAVNPGMHVCVDDTLIQFSRMGSTLVRLHERNTPIRHWLLLRALLHYTSQTTSTVLHHHTDHSIVYHYYIGYIRVVHTV
jgi:hypothetical protein